MVRGGLRHLYVATFDAIAVLNGDEDREPHDAVTVRRVAVVQETFRCYYLEGGGACTKERPMMSLDGAYSSPTFYARDEATARDAAVSAMRRHIAERAGGSADVE